MTEQATRTPEIKRIAYLKSAGILRSALAGADSAAGLQEPTVKVEPLTADQIAAIAVVYRSGATIVQCMDRFRETSWRVRSALTTAGVQMRPRGIPKRGTRMKSRG
jgi:hypothetical protein